MLLTIFAVTCATANNLTIASADFTANLSTNIVAIGLANRPAAGATLVATLNSNPVRNETTGLNNVATNAKPNIPDTAAGANAITTAVSAWTATARNFHGTTRAVARNGANNIGTMTIGASATEVGNSA